MSVWLIALVSLIYLLAGVGFAIEGKYGLALFSVGCVIANCGLILQGR